MSEARVVRAIPGTPQAGDLIGRDRTGAWISVHVLTDDELEALQHPSRAAV